MAKVIFREKKPIKIHTRFGSFSFDKDGVAEIDGDALSVFRNNESFSVEEKEDTFGEVKKEILEPEEYKEIYASVMSELKEETKKKKRGRPRKIKEEDKLPDGKGLVEDKDETSETEEEDPLAELNSDEKEE